MMGIPLDYKGSKLAIYESLSKGALINKRDIAQEFGDTNKMYLFFIAKLTFNYLILKVSW